MAITKLQIEGMNCEHCVKTMNQLIEEIKGVNAVNVSLSENEACIWHDDVMVNSEIIIDHINSSKIYKAKQK